MNIEIKKMSVPGADDQLVISLDGLRVATFSNSVTMPLNFRRGMRPEITMRIAAAVVEWLTNNPVENLPSLPTPPAPPPAVGSWHWIPGEPAVSAAPLPKESTAQAIELSEATETITDG